MGSRLMTLLVAAIAIVAIGVGCGGDEDSGDGSPANGAATDGTDAGSGDQGGSGEADSQSDGGDRSGDGDTGDTSTDKETFIKRASQACVREGQGLLDKMSNYLRKHQDDGPQGVVMAKMAKQVILPSVEAQIAAVRKIEPPEGDEEQIEEMLAAQERAVAEVRGLKSVKSLDELQTHFREAGELFEEYGFNACKLA